MRPKIFFVALGLLGLAWLYPWITPTSVPTKTPIPTVPEATPTPTPDRAADWVLRDVITLEGDIRVTLQGIVWKAPYWYVSASVPSVSQFNIGRIYRYTNDGASVDTKTFNVLDYPDLPYKAHASSLDYSPVADRLYWAWMQDNLEPKGSAISEHDPVTLEMTRSWDTSALTTYMDAVAIDPATGDLWYGSRRDLVRVPYSSRSGFDFSAVTIYGLKPYSSSRASEGSPPLLGFFSGLRIRGGLIYAFTHTSEASARGLGPRTNNGLVVYDMASLSTVDPLANDYLRFYNYSYPEEAPDQEGGDIVAGHAIVTSPDERIWLLELLQE